MTSRPYRDALDWLFSRTRGGAPRDPARMQALLDQLALPAPLCRVHVTGTNGKSTVTSLIAAGLSSAGVRTGRFISPHVEDFRERIAVDGRLISEHEVTELVAIFQALEPVPAAAFFEFALALALAHFQREQVGFAVLEAGVGARFDATSVLPATVLTVITSVALDHTNVLGSTVTDITRDKSAAIRPGVPVVTAETGVALRVIRDTADRLGSLLLHPASQPELFAPPADLAFAGGTRGQNQRLAVAALRQLGAGTAALETALALPPLPGRSERFSRAGVHVLLDGAHDPAAARALRCSLDVPYVLLFGALNRKQGLATLAPLAKGAQHVILTSVGDELPLAGTQYRVQGAREAALAEAVAAAGPGGLIVIAGSLYLAGEFRSWLSPRS